MTLPNLVFAAIWAAFTLYILLGGADFGGGLWDLLAWGPTAPRQRRAIATAMGPVWEANHVWLIFVLVGLFTNFPLAFTTLSVALFVPFTLVLIGIVLRGASFTFRAHGADAVRLSTAWGRVFGIASTFTPAVLGTCAGAVTTGQIRVRDGLVTADPLSAWTGPFSLLCGGLALAVCAYLAAIFLAVEAQEAGDRALAAIFRRRALAAGLVGGALALAGLALARTQAPLLWAGLSGKAIGLVGGSIVLALAANGAVIRRSYRPARLLAVPQVALMLAAWAYAQAPYLIVPDVTIENAASPSASMAAFAIATATGGLLLLPSLWLLLRVFKGHNPAPSRQPAAW
jgi:cytochrome d ubiquinol oxidase subunit II